MRYSINEIVDNLHRYSTSQEYILAMTAQKANKLGRERVKIINTYVTKEDSSYRVTFECDFDKWL